MAVVPAEAATSAAVDVVEGLLDAITALKARQKELEQELAPLLEALSAAMAAGQLDPSFCHHDWAFSHSPGRLSYDFPAPVLELEQQLKAARDAAIRQGTASEKRGKPYWTIRPPKTQALPF